MIRMRVFSFTLISVCVPLLLISCGGKPYGVDAVNHGQHGVLLLEFGSYPSHTEQEVANIAVPERNPVWVKGTPGLIGATFVKRLYPSIPSATRNPADSMIRRFPGHESWPPQEVQVAWQLAELSNCELNRKAKSTITIKELNAIGRDPEFHRIASHCTWHLLPDKIFRKTVDMKAVMKSPEVKKAGWNARLNLTFEFIEDELRVIPEAYAINHWQ